MLPHVCHFFGGSWVIFVVIKSMIAVCQRVTGKRRSVLLLGEGPPPIRDFKKIQAIKLVVFLMLPRRILVVDEL